MQHPAMLSWGADYPASRGLNLTICGMVVCMCPKIANQHGGRTYIHSLGWNCWRTHTTARKSDIPQHLTCWPLHKWLQQFHLRWWMWKVVFLIRRCALDTTTAIGSELAACFDGQWSLYSVVPLQAENASPNCYWQQQRWWELCWVPQGSHEWYLQHSVKRIRSPKFTEGTHRNIQGQVRNHLNMPHCELPSRLDYQPNILWC